MKIERAGVTAFNPCAWTGMVENNGEREFTSPDQGDWVLVLGDAAKNYSVPGKPLTPK